MDFYEDEWISPSPNSIRQQSHSDGSWGTWSFNRVMGLSFMASFLQNEYLFNSARLLILGTLIETGRRLCYWLMERFKFQYCVTARFDEGDPTYDWILLFLTEKKVWRRSQDFVVNAKNSKRKWSINTGSGSKTDGIADYVPTYELPQLFRWQGYWVEVKRSKSGNVHTMSPHGPQSSATIYISIYTLNMSALSDLVWEARDLYRETSGLNVVVYTADIPTYGPAFMWSNVKNKARRPLSSIILLEGVINSLVKDAQEFIDSEEWYVEAGIPYRRGYLLYGPPGTGKTSTIYALAGSLGLEIYSLSLSSHFVDDSFLQKAASSIPKHSIFLIEDIDCAFPPREDADPHNGYHSMNQGYPMMGGMYTPPPMGRVGQHRRSLVTLSGLLNVLDGVGSEEGKLFFATTNYIERLDAALLRPGRIDKRMQYFLATPAQASALFTRFYGRWLPPTDSLVKEENEKPPKDIDPVTESPVDIAALSSKFASHIPTHTFSTAELQGYLLLHKKEPEDAAAGVKAWVEGELSDRVDTTRKDEARKKRQLERWWMGNGAGVPVYTGNPVPGAPSGLAEYQAPSPLPGIAPVDAGVVPVDSAPGGMVGGSLPVSMQVPTPQTPLVLAFAEPPPGFSGGGGEGGGAEV